MLITVEIKNEKCVVIPEGRLDTVTSPQLEKEVSIKALPDVTDVTLDFSKLEYISSAGLRVILSLQKRMDKQGGKLTIIGVNEMIMELFEITGMIDVLSIQ